MSDLIHIRGVQVDCIVGINDHERVNRQPVIIEIALECDMQKAAETDDIADAVNYKTLKDAVVAHVEQSRYFLVERLAQSVAEICLAVPGVEAVRVSVDKPTALTGARSVGVEIYRRHD